jgi:hypothetical protein
MQISKIRRNRNFGLSRYTAKNWLQACSKIAILLRLAGERLITAAKNKDERVSNDASEIRKSQGLTFPPLVNKRNKHWHQTGRGVGEGGDVADKHCTIFQQQPLHIHTGNEF